MNTQELNEEKSSEVKKFQNEQAKKLGLTHFGNGLYKDKSGKEYEWNSFRYEFIQIIRRQNIKDRIKQKLDEVFTFNSVKKSIDICVNCGRAYKEHHINSDNCPKNGFPGQYSNSKFKKIDKLKESLDEATFYFDDEQKEKLRNQKAKVYNLKHMGHGTYKNPAGHEFAWDDTTNEFYLIKRNSDSKPTNIVQFPKKEIQGGDIPVKPTKEMKKVEDPFLGRKIYHSIKDGSLEGSYLLTQINAKKEDVENFFGEPFDTTEDNKGYGQTFKVITFSNRESYTVYSRDGKFRIGGYGEGPNFDILKRRLEGRLTPLTPTKSILDNPPPGGWREEDKIPSKVHDNITKQREYIKQNKELLKTQDVYNKKKGDTFKQINVIYPYFSDKDSDFGKEKEITITKIINLEDKKVFHTTYGKYSIPHPEGYKHPEKEIKPIKDRILDKLNLDTDFKEVSNDDQFSKSTKFITKDYALNVVDGWDLYLNIYSNPENIGKRGTSIKKTSIVIDYGKNHGSKYVWDKTIIDRLKKEKPKTIEELNSFIERQIQEIKSEEKYFRVNKYEDKLKGIDKEIPDFGLEGEYEDIKGSDIYVEFDKPDIVITSSKDEKSAGGFSHPKITIKWHNAKKLNKVKDQLKNAIGLDQINKILQDNGILSKYTNYTDAQFT